MINGGTFHRIPIGTNLSNCHGHAIDLLVHANSENKRNKEDIDLLVHAISENKRNKEDIDLLLHVNSEMLNRYLKFQQGEVNKLEFFLLSFNYLFNMFPRISIFVIILQYKNKISEIFP